jgi:uncharacterized membrane protein YgcG
VSACASRLGEQRNRRSTVKLRFSMHSRRAARQVAMIDSYDFPSSVRQRLRLKYPNLATESIELIEAATRQWFRILARHPQTRLSMPSLMVDDMWHELLLHTRDYAAFCDAAFGRFLHHEPESAMTPDCAAANRSDRLLETLRLARRDENCWPELPLLFRVDYAVGRTEARRYIADCGARGHCSSSTPDLVCLHHLAGLERLKPSRYRGNPLLRAHGYVGGGDGGGGCGGGGCGGGGGGGCGGGGCGGGG